MLQTGDLIKKWDRGWLLDPLWLPMRYTSKIDEMRGKIADENAQMGHFLLMLNSQQLFLNQPATDAKNAAEIKTKLDKQEKLIKAMRDEAHERDQALQELLQKISKDKIIEAACSNDPRQWQDIEKDLAKARPTMTANDAQKVLEPFREEIKSRKQRMTGPILCVDLRQGALSTMAQFHLEYLRLHASTKSKDYFTQRIEAAGYRLKSDLTERAIKSKAVSFAIEPRQGGARYALNYVESAYGEETKAFELIRLENRLRNDKEPHGVKLRHFQECDHILCFNEQSYVELIKLRQFAEKLQPADARRPLKGWITNLSVHWSDYSASKAFNNVKTAVNAFVEKELDWTPPTNLGQQGARIWHNPYRARQFLIPYNKGSEKDGNKKAVHKAAADIKRQTGCVMVLAYYQSYYSGSLVTIVGPKDVLEKAEAMAKAVCG